jgi:hypothetical protein
VIKMLICLVCAFLVALATLQLRQQELELRHRAAALQEQLQARQAKMWEQQVVIASKTAPNALTATVAGQDLKLVPAGKLPLAAGDWVGKPPVSDPQHPEN